ncbi:uncharacterized protein LOC127001045 [Eriocheir sinensis]|uniref:uncharacterized protein LOC127001045 n=1 Tax=Eriocheir sinensis TaxID=95602 RepID=UPI0021C7AC87|nr:uncharacterized protein LOC127001045 [Eriocheir sinensis]
MGRSKHASILWSPAPSTSRPARTVAKTYRPVTDSAVQQFGQWITRYPWAEVLSVEDVQDKWNNYQQTITTAHHHFFPEKSLRTHPSDAPWITPRIKRLMQQRNSAFFTDPSLFKHLRNKVIREIKAAKLTYYPNKIHKLKQGNISRWYSKIRDLCGLNKTTVSIPGVALLPAPEAAEVINTHFADICQSLPSLDLTSLTAYLPTPAPLPLVQDYEDANALLKLKSRRSTTPTDLPIKLYQGFSTELFTPLCSIFNASLHQSQCPAAWKTAYVTPVPKTSTPQSLSDYRPIAITPIPSLLCEGFIFRWAYTHLAPLMDQQQFGNIKSSSTTHCLIDLLDYVYRNLEKRKTSVALTFVDFRKAFDLVHHTTVITKAISSLIKSVTYQLHLLRRLKKLGTPARELASVYSTFILPRLTYASPAWSSSLNAINSSGCRKGRCG